MHLSSLLNQIVLRFGPVHIVAYAVHIEWAIIRMCRCRLDHYLGSRSAINQNILQFKYVQAWVAWWITKYRCNEEIKLGSRITQTQFPCQLQFSECPPLMGRCIWFRQIQNISIKCKCFCRHFLFWHASIYDLDIQMERDMLIYVNQIFFILVYLCKSRGDICKCILSVALFIN